MPQQNVDINTLPTTRVITIHPPSNPAQGTTEAELAKHRYIKGMLAEHEGLTTAQAVDVVKRFYGTLDAAKDALDEVYNNTNNTPIVGKAVTEKDGPYCTLSFDDTRGRIIARLKAVRTYTGIPSNLHYLKRGYASNGTDSIYIVTMTISHPKRLHPPKVWNAMNSYGLFGCTELIEPWDSDDKTETYLLRPGTVIRFSYGKRKTEPFVVPSPDEVGKSDWGFERSFQSA